MYDWNYRVVLEDAGTSAAFINMGYTPATAIVGLDESVYFNSLGEAVTQGLALNRRWQQNGRDCRFKVFGTIVDDTTNGKPAAPADGAGLYTLTGGDKAEQLFIDGDTPDQEYTKKINAANRILATVTGGFGTSQPEDVAGDTT